MNIYLLSQTENSDYDTFDSCVVCAEDENDAKSIMPSFGKGKPFEPSNPYGTWAHSIESVHCKYIGEAAEGIERGTICESFNAG